MLNALKRMLGLKVEELSLEQKLFSNILLAKSSREYFHWKLGRFN